MPVDIELPDDGHSRPVPLDHERRNPTAPVTREDLASFQRQQTTTDLRMTALEAQLQINTSITASIRDILEAAKFGLRVLGVIGTLVTWLAKVIGAIVAIYAGWQAIRAWGWWKP